MTYATMMVHLQPGQSNSGLLQVAGDLAERFHASVIGIAACQPIQVAYNDIYISGDLIEQDREEIQSELQEAEAEFRSALHNRGSSLAWRSALSVTSVADYLAREVRSADLLITSSNKDRSSFDAARYGNTGDLVMQAGRPLLVVPPATEKLRLDRVLVGWKDTREARRAISDALPLLKLATDVVVVQAVAEDQLGEARARLEDVVGWLKRHGVVAQSRALPSAGNDTARLQAFAQEQRADLIVAGAYGHSRLREWVFGGVTHDLLLRSEQCSFVSH
jgi:nucleotide-binding universal stress UspA family protein